MDKPLMLFLGMFWAVAAVALLTYQLMGDVPQIIWWFLTYLLKAGTEAIDPPEALATQHAAIDLLKISYSRVKNRHGGVRRILNDRNLDFDGPQHPSYQMLQKRVESFNNPRWQTASRAPIENFALAGLYYDRTPNYTDSVKCFICGGGAPEL